tara:strand:- start:2221 stop:2538 length:318 start_codon:yes stop_codon:yes gene_type:complete
MSNSQHNTLALTMNVVAVCGKVSADAQNSWQSEPLPGSPLMRDDLFRKEIREAAEIAESHKHYDVSHALYLWLGVHMDKIAGSIYSEMAALAAFSYRYGEISKNL